ncbi:hypothetical protein GDO81_015809 [Engystomops pustulosus]|uniref:Uncharacterized protein n=1 Tax=Engystomops pustulosus TaxID=76066 RepID=A0AAV7AML2_ENGPU|nr:hypothetical protein GDO81_015809 [Engystomops pustulosus]
MVTSSGNPGARCSIYTRGGSRRDTCWTPAQLQPLRLDRAHIVAAAAHAATCGCWLGQLLGASHGLLFAQLVACSLHQFDCTLHLQGSRYMTSSSTAKIV